jgi:phosphatidate cytidylyltransferase
MFLFETIVFNIVIAAICLMGIYELYNAYQFDKAWYVYAGFIPFTLLVFFSSYATVRSILLPAGYLFALYLAVCVIANSKSLNFAKLGGMVFFSCLVMLGFYSFIYLKQLLPQELYGYDAIYFIFLILGCAWGGDSAAYFAGRAFGRRKLAPVVSPNKTVEGAIGGVLGSMLLSVVITTIYTLVSGRLLGMPMRQLGVVYYIVIILMGGVASVLGILGDLFASVIKRQCGIKDYGSIFPGHGGILDRFDSVMFIAPFVSIVVTAVFYSYIGG